MSNRSGGRLTAFLRGLCIIAPALLGACATVDYDFPKAESHAITDTSSTTLGAELAPLVAAHPGQSGFQLQPDGIEALASRLVLAGQAEESIDVQYYLITDDMVGFLFLGSLVKAADRGVRVRLLLDDILTQGYDTGMAALDSHPNIQIRIFNPWKSRGLRALDIGSYSTLNRRMHNKSFTVDNSITVIGGRNIADEYFGAAKDVNFGDIDVLGIGPVVQEVSDMFDQYWNSEKAMPVPAFADMPDDPDQALKQLRKRLEDTEQSARESRYGAAVIADADKFINATEDMLAWAPYRLAVDSPDKAEKKLAAEAAKITDTLAEVVAEAEHELTVISPYFVPRKSGVEYFQTLVDRGLDVTVITNSLAANNHGIVHSGYMGYRKKLLKMGVKLYEVKVTASIEGVERGGSGAELATLHTKAFIVDREMLFVGSFNWDPRSVDINTELGVVIESPEIAGATAAQVDASLATKVYQVELDERGKLQWVDRSGQELRILTKEPDTTWWRRTKAQLGRWLPIHSQL